MSAESWYCVSGAVGKCYGLKLDLGISTCPKPQNLTYPVAQSALRLASSGGPHCRAMTLLHLSCVESCLPFSEVPATITT